MSERVHEASGIKVDLDEERLSKRVAREVAQHLASLFPADAAEFWGVLAEQAYRERRRVAATLDLVCSRDDGCPYKSDILAGVQVRPDDSSDNLKGTTT